MAQRVYPLLLLVLILASYFHMQAIVLAIALFIIAMPMQWHFTAIKMARLFAVLLLPSVLGLIAGYKNDNYLIIKDFYYFLMPVLFIASGIVLACRITIESFLKTLVVAGTVVTGLVTAISVSYVGFGALTDPYSAHYAIGIVGTPGPPIAFACLLLTYKFNIRLYKPMMFNALVAINAFGIYMFASRTYLIITLCFLFLLVADKMKKVWILPIIFIIASIFIVLPFNLLQSDSSNPFVNKILHSFSEMSIGEYNTEQDINTKYRGYESFMALKGYAEGDVKDWIFGGLGKLIDLKTFVRLGEDSDFQFIPVLHNGWLYILVKTGITGVMAYIIVFFTLIAINWKKYADARGKPVIRLFAALTVGCILSLLLTNYIVTAFFNVEMSIIMITLGYSYLNFHSLLFKLKEMEKPIEIKVTGFQAS
ncbi:hypothetical protein GCM10023149_39680 [Mucilaginibacter gynuensis]|uniref:O-antigen ligase-like membrane protein n=1 Tax=Mucilaginibacter gynuensis TaxID=1302236 RepID=A0ABP8H1M6_9SPHI